MSTRAIDFLKRKRIAFEVVKYEHAAKGAAFAARAVGFPLAKTVKTLVVAFSDKTYCLALMPGNKQLSLKRLASMRGVKKAAMADTAAAEKLTGYLIGGISPFGTTQPLPAIIDERLLDQDSVVINGGQRGLLLKMDVMDIVAALDCKASNIAHE